MTAMVATGSVEVVWQGMRVEATRPAAIADLTLELDAPTVRRVERAAAAVLRAADHQGHGLEVAARLLLRSEGLASSAIEGLRASARAVALARAASAEPGTAGAGDLPDDTAAWVADNLAVVQDALAHRRRLSIPTLHRWHRRLMRNATGVEARHVGAFRDTLGWVGGPNPRMATHVAAPADLIRPAMADLVAFTRRIDIDAVTQAAIAHAQFETVHPYADGNGRLGRVLVGWVLARRLEVAVPPPVSLEMARDVGGYQAGLTLYRQGDVEQWLGWFAEAVASAAARSTDTLTRVAQLQADWRVRLMDVRADAAAHALLAHLPANPALTAASAAALVGVSRQSASVALAQLAGRGVLEEVDASEVPTGRGRPARWYVAEELLALLGG